MAYKLKKKYFIIKKMSRKLIHSIKKEEGKFFEKSEWSLFHVFINKSKRSFESKVWEYLISGLTHRMPVKFFSGLCYIEVHIQSNVEIFIKILMERGNNFWNYATHDLHELTATHRDSWYLRQSRLNYMSLKLRYVEVR